MILLFCLLFYIIHRIFRVRFVELFRFSKKGIFQPFNTFYGPLTICAQQPVGEDGTRQSEKSKEEENEKI